MNESISLLKKLIATPSFSKEENETASIIRYFLEEKNIPSEQYGNNIIAWNKFYHPEKPTILLNSHHDTVRPTSAWTKDPFCPTGEKGKLFGLGANDAGASLVSLVAAFVHFYNEDLPFNLVLAATAEEEISGKNGVESVLPYLGNIELAIVGEPTQMKMAVVEKGLLVVDCIAEGKTGHAARNEGENAIYKAMKDIEWFRAFQFAEVSPLLGPVQMNVTMINAGTQHNVVPDKCLFTVDIRVNEYYSHEEILNLIRKNVSCSVTPRSTRLRSSSTPEEHSFVKLAKEKGIELFGSPTMSDMALIPFPSVKIGPGDSARSHTADEFIFIREIEEGIQFYIQLLTAYAQLDTDAMHRVHETSDATHSVPTK